MGAWYEDEVRGLEAKIPSIAPSPLLLYGGSSIRLWGKAEKSFPGRRVVNHGFGGSTLAECVDCFDRLVTPVRPSALLLYAGDNDLSQGADAAQVLASFRRFVERMAALPPIPWAVLSVKPSPSRRHLADEIRLTNRLLEMEVRALPGVTFIDIHTPMSDERADPPFRYFIDDWLHMNRAGYEVWGRAVRPWLSTLSTTTPSVCDGQSVTPL